MKDDGKKFVVREFKEVEGGKYDDYNFYYTPNGSNIPNNSKRFLGW